MIETLKKILSQEDTVLFIGSGISTWSGIPSWSGLIKELIAFLDENGLDSTLVNQELKNGDLLQAASYGFDKLTKPLFAKFIRQSCRLGIAKPQEIHHKIISLGPVCYITTNYDKLLELSFSKWLPDSYFRNVINTQLTETAEIVGARAQNFVFKLHGDVEDSDSIILTREQYRSLNFGGDLYHALETAKTLMVSRPIVYIGFGLRDPDFLYLKDLLFNTYRGGARDHYAIMADVSEQEKDYWKRNFGIHLVSYETKINEDGSKNHEQILNLLEQLNKDNLKEEQRKIEVNPEFILGLNRHAAKYLTFSNSNLHLPLVVRPIQNQKKNKSNFYSNRYYEKPIEDLLDSGPDKTILIGLPGGGKSYSLKGSVNRIAKILSDACIDDKIKLGETIIPIYVDLKLYQGNLIELIEQNIPVGMDLRLLSANFKVKLYLDAFNEISREYIESNQWDFDFGNFLSEFSNEIVITSRSMDGLENLEFNNFKIDSISEDFIEKNLTENGIELNELFRCEIIELLRKPLFYKLIFEKRFNLETESSPKKLYNEFLKSLISRCMAKFDVDFNLFKALSRTAKYAIDNGEEAYKIEILEQYLFEELNKNKIVGVNSTEVINWLVGQDLLIPTKNERIYFFHQSITEYLAATELAEIFLSDASILKEKLSYRRWDQALFLTLSLLPKEKAEKFLETIIKLDFELAISSVKYMENDSKEIVEILLNQLLSSSNYNDSFQIQTVLENGIPLASCHIPLLEKIIKKGDSLGGSAAASLLNYLGEEYKETALKLLVKNWDDYNFCMQLSRFLEKYITTEDLGNLLSLSKVVQKKNNKQNSDESGFVCSVAYLVSDIDPESVYKTFFINNIELIEQDLQIKILSSFFRDSKSSKSLEYCLNLLNKGVEHMSVEIYFILRFSTDEDNIDYSIFNLGHIHSLLTILKNGNSNSDWAMSSLRYIIKRRKDLVSSIEREIIDTKFILKASLYYSLDNQEMVFKSLNELLAVSIEELNLEPFKLLSHFNDLNWKGQESLFVKLLKLKNKELATNVCENLSHRENEKHIIFDIGDISWWFDWLLEPSDSDDWMFKDRVPNVISKYISKKKKEEFIEEFNQTQSKYRHVISKIFLGRLDNLSLDNFTEESICYLLNDLKFSRLEFWEKNVLEDIADETFVNDKILPQLKTVKGIEKKNLMKLLQKIGEKHKRRYLIE